MVLLNKNNKQRRSMTYQELMQQQSQLAVNNLMEKNKEALEVYTLVFNRELAKIANLLLKDMQTILNDAINKLTLENQALPQAPTKEERINNISDDIVDGITSSHTIQEIVQKKRRGRKPKQK